MIFSKRGLRKHPVFAITETPRSSPTSKEVRPSASEPALPAPGEDPAWVRQLQDAMEKLGKGLYRLAVSQESLSQELQDILRHSGVASPNHLHEARRRLAEDFLPLIDSLHRLAQALAQQGNGALAEGAGVIAAKGDAYLAALGVEVIPSTGRRFDPRLHQALQVRPAPPEMEGCVVEEIVRGYRMGEKVLRTAQVVVAKGG